MRFLIIICWLIAIPLAMLGWNWPIEFVHGRIDR